MMNSNEMATLIRHCRKRSGLSQLQLAKLAGVGKTVIFDIEKGKATVQLNSMLKVLAILNIKIRLESPIAITQEKSS